VRQKRSRKASRRVGDESEARWAERRAGTRKSSRDGVHRADAVVWEPVGVITERACPALARYAALSRMIVSVFMSAANELVCPGWSHLGPFHTKRCRGGVHRRQLELKGVEVGD
jgi:hypothetical protein